MSWLLAAAFAGELHLVAVDPFGRPVDATWTLETGGTLEQGTVTLPAGRYRIAVTAGAGGLEINGQLVAAA